MSKEVVFVLEPDLGRVTVEISRSPLPTIEELEDDLGVRSNVNCAKPAGFRQLATRRRPQDESLRNIGTRVDYSTIWLYSIYHNSATDGPGRQSVVQVSGCSIRCKGCYVPQTHERENRGPVPVASIDKEILASSDKHDGVTILGGEPFDQPGPVAENVFRLKRHGIHLTVYTGYTLKALVGRKHPSVDFILSHVDLLIDGPFVTQLSKNAAEYRGLQNQRLIGNVRETLCDTRTISAVAGWQK